MACEALPGPYWPMDWPTDVMSRQEPGSSRSWLPARRTAGIYPGGCGSVPGAQPGIHQTDDSAKRFHPPSSVSSGMGDALTRPHSPLGPASIGWQSSVTSAGATGGSSMLGESCLQVVKAMLSRTWVRQLPSGVLFALEDGCTPAADWSSCAAAPGPVGTGLWHALCRDVYTSIAARLQSLVLPSC